MKFRCFTLKFVPLKSPAMQKLFISVTLALLILVISCKKENTNNDQISILDAITVTDSASSKFLEFAAVTEGDPYEALVMTRDWIIGLDPVEKAMVQDSTYLRIKLKSGLLTSFYYDRIDEEGLSLFRGGGAKGSGKLESYSSGNNCSNPIQNKNVLIFAAAFKEFYGTSNYLENIAKIFTDAGPEFKVTILKDEQCTHEVLNTFGNFGLVIIDTHGAQDAFMLGYKLILDPKPVTEEEVREKIKNQFGENVLNMILNGNIGYSAGSRIRSDILDWFLESNIETVNALWIRTQYINSLDAWPETVIMGNMCYSGSNKINEDDIPFYSSPLMREAMLNRDLISYYAYALDNEYSLMVSDKLAQRMEDSLSRALVADGDSTGIAHLKSDNTEFNDIYYSKQLKFKHFGADDYCFGRCGLDLVDARDGKKYKTVCINNQVWMAENLDYEVNGSACYDYFEINCDSYGKLYTWDMVMNGESSSAGTPSGVRGICPEGWHVPSTAEWQNLIVTLGGDPLAGGALKATEGWESPNTGAENSSGFSALPGGSAAWLYSGFLEKGRQASYWTSTEITSAPDQADQRTLYYNTEEVNRISRNKNDGLSLRCIKD